MGRAAACGRGGDTGGDTGGGWCRGGRRRSGAMMVDVRLVGAVPADTTAVAVGVFADQLSAAPEPTFLASGGFTGAVGEAVAIPPAERDGPVRVVAGLGAASALDEVALRRAAASVARASRRYDRVAMSVPSASGPAGGVRGLAAAAAIVEGFLLGGYRFTRYRSEAPNGTSQLAVVLSSVAGAASTAAVARA